MVIGQTLSTLPLVILKFTQYLLELCIEFTVIFQVCHISLIKAMQRCSKQTTSTDSLDLELRISAAAKSFVTKILAAKYSSVPCLQQ